MRADALIVKHGGAELFAVPAIHFNHVFARTVNAICLDPETRPDAVAVEVGPRTASRVVQWLRELGVGAGEKKTLPVMLGLLKRNRLIKASLREKALRLQEETGKDLNELPPDMLRRELGFTGGSLLCLSPADSIIEAIRCGIELDIPIHGVDLEEMADGVYKTAAVQYPVEGEGLATYIERNASFAENQRDDEVDHRRELAMAARIKALLKRHRRVLFTCGMAHWRRVRRLLEDASVRPALLPETVEVNNREFTRVVVHPRMAAQFMGMFPALAMTYEKTRRRAGSNVAPDLYMPDTEVLFHRIIKRAYRDYFHGKGTGTASAGHGRDIERLGDFQAYLENLCLFSHQPTPDLSMTIKAAREMMSREFVSALFESFMRLPWASPEEFPGCALLSPSTGSEPGSAVLEGGRDRRKNFCLRDIPDAGVRPTPDVPFEWEKSKKLSKVVTVSLTSHTWRPWDNLISSMSFRAINAAVKRHAAKKTVVFEGSMLEGIDVKETLRSYSRGDSRIFVRDLSNETAECLNPIERFPVVWVFDPEYSQGAEWIVLHEPLSYMKRYIRDGASFERMAKRQGYNMVATIGYGSRCPKGSGFQGGSVVRTDKYHGLILFQPICWTNKQFARWAEMTGYRRNPFSNDSSLSNDYSDMVACYKRHGIEIREFHWATALILMALPFAKDVLSVVVPDGYSIDKAVHRKAREYGITVCPISHNLFSRAELERIALCQLVPVITHEPECLYSKAVEDEIGELQTDYRQLVPEWLLEFSDGR